MKKIKLTDIITTSGTQTRAEIHEDVVAEYAEQMKAGDTFPPVVVFHDKTDYHLADGFHRVLAAARAGLAAIDADVRKGTRQDALLYSIGANATHGLRRTNADKRRCVELALAEWPRWSDRRLAKACGVDHEMVGVVRSESTGGNRQFQEPAKRVGADGKERALPVSKEWTPPPLTLLSDLANNIPPAGAVLYETGTDNIRLAWVNPSEDSRYLFVTRTEFDTGGGCSLVGLRKPCRADGALHFLEQELTGDGWRGFERADLEPGDRDAGPWTYNKLLFDTEDASRKASVGRGRHEEQVA
jgi:hypothetical protein